jgi:GntR family transcriptional regulator, transcriptional repressor for pyruvate dehydrogenase complex
MTGQAASEGFLGRGELTAELERKLIAGEWPPGTRLPSERELSERHNVSRPVVREALRSLHERGLIEVLPNRGSYVRPFSAQSVARQMRLALRQIGVTPRQLTVARLMLECEAAELAALNASTEDRERLLEAHQRTGRGGDLYARAANDVAFHAEIARAGGNPVIETMFASIRDVTYGLILRSLSDREVRKAGEPLHTTILERILERDGAGARAAMREHLELAHELYGEDLDRPLFDVLAPLLGDDPAVAAVRADTLATGAGRS